MVVSRAVVTQSLIAIILLWQRFLLNAINLNHVNRL